MCGRAVSHIGFCVDSTYSNLTVVSALMHFVLAKAHPSVRAAISSNRCIISLNPKVVQRFVRHLRSLWSKAWAHSLAELLLILSTTRLYNRRNPHDFRKLVVVLIIITCLKSHLLSLIKIALWTFRRQNPIIINKVHLVLPCWTHSHFKLPPFANTLSIHTWRSPRVVLGLAHVVLSLLLTMSILGIPILLLIEYRRHVVFWLHRPSRENILILLLLLLNALGKVSRLSIVRSHLAERNQSFWTGNGVDCILVRHVDRRMKLR